MTFWDEIYELVRKVDDENLRIYVNIYNLPDDEGKILVFDDWDSSKAFNKLLAKKIRNYPEVQKEIKDFIYDVDDRDDWFLDLATEDNWTYSDEGFECSECNCWYYYEQYNACGYANYKVYDGWIECSDCIKRDTESKERYLEDLIDNPKNANTILEYKDFLDLDFEKVNEDSYANGWYHRTDDPVKILSKAKAEDENAQYVFSIRKTYNPWETEFDLYKRETA